MIESLSWFVLCSLFCLLNRFLQMINKNVKYNTNKHLQEYLLFVDIGFIWLMTYCKKKKTVQ